MAVGIIDPSRILVFNSGIDEILRSTQPRHLPARINLAPQEDIERSQLSRVLFSPSTNEILQHFFQPRLETDHLIPSHYKAMLVNGHADIDKAASGVDQDDSKSQVLKEASSLLKNLIHEHGTLDAQRNALLQG